MISIIIPVYNAERYLRECLDSVLAQTLREFEVICVDDGSTDGSPAILADYAKRDARVKVISSEHTNAGHCRNVGLAHARGEYLLFLDADDCFAPKMLETLLDAARETNADVAICGHVDFHDGDDFKRHFGRKGGRRVSRAPAENVDIYQWGSWPWDKLIARRLIDRYSLTFQEQRTINDVLFILTALTVAETIVECPRILVAYRKMRKGSLTMTRSKSPRCFYDAFTAYYDKMCELGIFPANKRLLECYSVYSCGQSFWHFDSVPGVDAAQIVFPLLKEMCSRWNWREALEADGRNPFLLRRCGSLMQANDLLEMLLLDSISLREGYAELIYIKHSRSYRFARLLVKAFCWFRRFFSGSSKFLVEGLPFAV